MTRIINSPKSFQTGRSNCNQPISDLGTRFLRALTNCDMNPSIEGRARFVEIGSSILPFNDTAAVPLREYQDRVIGLINSWKSILFQPASDLMDHFYDVMALLNRTKLQSAIVSRFPSGSNLDPVSKSLISLAEVDLGQCSVRHLTASEETSFDLTERFLAIAI
jgi:hypothetical protein